MASSLAAIVSGHTLALVAGSAVASGLWLCRWSSRRRCFAAAGVLLAQAAAAARLDSTLAQADKDLDAAAHDTTLSLDPVVPQS